MSEKCKEVINGIKSFYINEMPINLNNINCLSELNEDEAKEVKERSGIECVILSPTYYELFKDIKKLIIECENEAESYFQDVEDGESEGEKLLAKSEAYKEVIKLITGNKPVLI